MKKFLIAFLLLPVFSMAQHVVTAERVFPKPDKVAEFEKALAAHAQKFHSGQHRWRIFDIHSGPDAGGYHITEGPKTWDEVDSRGDLGADHMADWNKNVAPLLHATPKTTYAVFQEELSTVAVSDYADWISIGRITPNPGYMDDLRSWIGLMKKVWEMRKESIAVYSMASSGANGFTIVTRYKQGLKERAAGFRPPFRDDFEKVHGKDSWNNHYLELIRKSFKESSFELLRFRADLSSK